MSLIVRQLPDGGCVIINNSQPSKSVNEVKPSPNSLFGESKVKKKEKKFVFREPEPPRPKTPRRLFKVNHDTKTIEVRLPHSSHKLVFKPHVTECPMVKMEDLIKANGTISLWDEDATGKVVEIRLGPDWKTKSTMNKSLSVNESPVTSKIPRKEKPVEAEKEKYNSAKKHKLSSCELQRAPKSQKWESVETPRKKKEIEKPKVCPRKLELEMIPEDDEPACSTSDFMLTADDDDVDICLFATGTAEDLLIGLNDFDLPRSPVQAVRAK